MNNKPTSPHINTFKVASLGAALAGRGFGERQLPEWRNAAETALTGPWLLDFSKTHGTYSYLDATLGAMLQRFTSDWLPGLLPVACNLDQDTFDELMPVLRLRGVALWVRLAGKDSPWRVAGPLDESLQKTILQLIASRGPLGSRQLQESNRDISQSGWANRLTALARMRLVGRERTGKKFEYRVTPTLIETQTALDQTAALFAREHHGIS